MRAVDDCPERTPWVRVVLVLTISFLVLFPALLALAWVRFAGGRNGWVLALLAFGLLGLVTGWATVPRRWPRVRARAAVGLAVIAGLGGIAVAHWAPPTAARLRHEIDEIARPGWELRRSTTDGSALCFDYCTSVFREYRAPDEPDAVLDDLRPVLERHGLRAEPPGDPATMVFVERAGDVDLRVEIEPADDGGSTVLVSATT